MSIVEFLSQPVWQRLGLTLLHFLWQGLAIAVLVGAVVRVFGLKHGNSRYVAYLLAFIAMIVCPVITFTAIDIPISPKAESMADAAIPPVVEIVSYVPPPAVDIVPKAVSPAPVEETAADSIALSERMSHWLDMSMPWLLVVWMVGVVLLSGRLVIGFVGVYRWRQNVQPLPEILMGRLGPLSERLRMHGFSRVFVSPSVLQAMAVGYLRPMVLLPAAMVARMQPEMLEAVIAHELAHIRRFDLRVNLAQRVTETLLFYHPAVWWLSGCLRSEREFCCDELAVQATGERITYASTLESLSRARSTTKRPVLAAGLGQDKKPTLSRVRHILGMRATQRNCPFWLAGVITVVLLAAIAVPTSLALRSKSHGDVEDLQSVVIEGIRANRAKFECGCLAWNSSRITTRFADPNRAPEDLKGEYELWWDGKKMASKYLHDQRYSDPEGNRSIKRVEGGNSYDGGVLSRKPRFDQDNWLGPYITRWRGTGSLDWLLEHNSKREGISRDWSVVDSNGVKIIRFTAKNMIETDRSYGGYSITDYDPSKGYGLVSEEWYDPNGRPRMKHTVKLQEVIPGGWFPVVIDAKFYAEDDWKVYIRNHYALDIERCRFNDRSVLPARVFEGAIDKQREHQKEVQQYLEMELKGISYVNEAGETDRVKRAAREAIETFIEAAMASDFEKARRFTDPNSAEAEQVTDIPEVLKGQNLRIMAVLADDFDAIAVSSVILGDHEQVGPLVFLLDRRPDEGRDCWWVNDIDIETADGAEEELKRFLEKYPAAHRVPSGKKGAIEVEGVTVHKQITDPRPDLAPDWDIAQPYKGITGNDSQFSKDFYEAIGADLKYPNGNAISKYREFIAKYPDSPANINILNVMCIVHLRYHQYDQAREAIEEAIEIAGEDRFVNMLEINLANVDMESGDLAAAEARLKRIIALPVQDSLDDPYAVTPQRFTAPFLLAKVCEKKGDIEKADKLLKEAGDIALKMTRENPKVKWLPSYAAASYQKRISLILEHDPENTKAAYALAEEVGKLLPDYNRLGWHHNMITGIRLHEERIRSEAAEPVEADGATPEELRKKAWRVFGMPSGVDSRVTVREEMNPEELITVRCVDNDGKGISYCRIVFVDRDEEETREFIDYVPTDDKGYAYCDEIDGTFSIMAQVFDYSHISKAWRFQHRKIETLYNANDKPVITVEWSPFPEGSGRIQGTVEDQYGRPLEEFDLNLKQREGENEGWGDCLTKQITKHFIHPEGKFEIANLAPGPYTYYVYPKEQAAYVWDWDMGEVTVGAEGTVQLHIEIEAKKPPVEVGGEEGKVSFLEGLYGKPAPELQQIKGWKNIRPVTLADQRGKFVLLYFWGSWCAPCLRDIPHLMAIHEAFSDRGLTVIGIHNDSVESISEMDGKLAKVLEMPWKVRDLKLPIALDGGGETGIKGTDETVRGATTAAYGITSYPTAVLIGRDGKVIGEFHAPSLDEKLEELEKVLGVQAKTPEWKVRFDEVYRLDDGEILRYIPESYIPQRNDFFFRQFSRWGWFEALPWPHMPQIPESSVLTWDGNKNQATGGMDFGGKEVIDLLRNFGFEESEFDGNPTVLDQRVPGDWIKRDTAKREDLLKAFENILNSKLNLSISFVPHEAERDAFVARGTFKFRPIEGEYPKNEIHLFAEKTDPPDNIGGGGGGGGSGNVDSFLAFVGQLRRTWVINETETDNVGRLVWRQHSSTWGERWQKDHALFEKLLENIEKQTSLRFDRERRKRKIWLVKNSDELKEARSAKADVEEAGATLTKQGDHVDTFVGLRGQVLFGTEKNPAVGAVVHILKRGQAWRSANAKSVKTGERGQFVFNGIDPGEYRIWAVHGDWVSRQKRYKARIVNVAGNGSAVEPVVLHLHEGCVLRVRAVSSITNQPLDQAQVYLPWSDIGHYFPADENGMVTVKSLTQEPWHYEVIAPGHGRVVRVANLQLGMKNIFEVSLPPGGTLSGIVTNGNNGGIEGVGVNLYPAGDGRPFAYVKTDPNGAYELPHVPINMPVDVRYNCKDFVSASRRKIVLTEPGQIRTLNVQLKKPPLGGSITGLVTDPQNQPVHDASVVFHTGSTSDIRKVKTDETGRFRMDNIPDRPGLMILTVRAGGYAPKNVEIKPGTPQTPQDLSIRLSPGHTIAGKVVDKTGRPIAGVWVFAGGNRFPNRIGGNMHTNQEGRFSFDSLPSSIPFDFEAQGYSSVKSKYLAVDRDDHVVVMEEQGVIEGRIVDAKSGRPIEHFNIRLRHSGDDYRGNIPSSLGYKGVDFSSEEGRFRIDGLDSGTSLMLLAKAPGYSIQVYDPVMVQGASRSEPVILKYEAELGMLSGQIVDANSHSLANLKVHAVVYKPNSRGMSFGSWGMLNSGQLAIQQDIIQIQQEVTDAKGHFQFKGIPSGYAIDLMIQGEGIPKVRREHIEKLPALERAKMVIQLPKASVVTGRINVEEYPDVGQLSVHLKGDGFSHRTISIGDNQQTYAFKDLEAGSYVLSIHGKRQANNLQGTFSYPRIGTIPFDIKTGETKNLDIGSSDPPSTGMVLPQDTGAQFDAGMAESAEMLKKLDTAISMYADDHDGTYPDKILDLHSYLDVEDMSRLLRNVNYLGKGKISDDPPTTPLAYDRTPAEDKPANVLFNDNRVELVTPEGLKKLGISRARLYIEVRYVLASDTFIEEVEFDPNSIYDANALPGFTMEVSPASDGSKIHALVLDQTGVVSLLRATQAHKDVKTLTAPRVTVLDGEMPEFGILDAAQYIPNRLAEKPVAKDHSVEPGSFLWVKPKLSPDHKCIDLDFGYWLWQLPGFEDRMYRGEYPYKIPRTELVTTKVHCPLLDGRTMVISGQKISVEEDGQRVSKTLTILVKAKRIAPQD